MSVMADSDHPCQETNQLCTPQSIKVVHGVSANAWFGIWRFSHAAKDFTDMAYAFTISRNFMALNASTSLYKLGDTDILYFGRICGVTILWEIVRSNWTVKSLSQYEDITPALDVGKHEPMNAKFWL